jgi:hypothetical protein
MALDLTVGTTKTTPAPDPQISYDDPFAVLVPPAPALTNAHHLVNVHQQKVTNLTRPYQTMSAPPDPTRSASLTSALPDHVLDSSSSPGPIRLIRLFRLAGLAATDQAHIGAGQTSQTSEGHQPMLFHLAAHFLIFSLILS